MNNYKILSIISIFLLIYFIIKIFSCESFLNVNNYNYIQQLAHPYTQQSYNLQKNINNEIKYISPRGIIGMSKIGTRGVFANRKYIINETIEICPCIKDQTNNIKGKLVDYMFNYDNENVLIAFGFCSMYNHSDDPNTGWTILDENKMIMKAIKLINEGDEILISYGNNYWKTRSELIKNS